jgi:hypothetical protein
MTAPFAFRPALDPALLGKIEPGYQRVSFVILRAIECVMGRVLGGGAALSFFGHLACPPFRLTNGQNPTVIVQWHRVLEPLNSIRETRQSFRGWLLMNDALGGQQQVNGVTRDRQGNGIFFMIDPFVSPCGSF